MVNIGKCLHNLAYYLCDLLELFDVDLACRWGFFIMNLYLNKRIRPGDPLYMQPTFRIVY